MSPSKKTLTACLAALALSACAEPVTAPQQTPPAVPLLGNGFPDNGHATLYKMNIIGHPGSPTSDLVAYIKEWFAAAHPQGV